MADADISGQINAPPSIADAIEKLRDNPEIISMVASALGGSSNLKPESKKESEPPRDNAEVQTDGVPSPANMGQLVSSLAPLLSSMGRSSGRDSQPHERDGRTSEREALLCALKPYVNENRRAAIDYVIRISQVSDMFKHLN